MHDLIIVGGGPAGAAATVYAARKRLKTALIAEKIGGQSIDSANIENWIGTTAISGADLATSFERHIEAVKNDRLAVHIGEKVVALKKENNHFRVDTLSGERHESRAILVATGASRKKLKIPGADEFENKGVVYCASCDGPLFGGMDVAVIGGGNAGFETALQLLSYAKSVTLLHRHKDLKADPITVEKARSHPNMRIIVSAEPTEIIGEQFVTGLKYIDKNSGKTNEINVSGIFAEIGVLPNTSFVQELVELDETKRIKVNFKNQRTSVEGVWAAGDCTDGLYHQNNIAAGDGVRALEDIYLWLKKL